MLVPLYDQWLEACFAKPLPQEKYATCAKCVMCEGAAGAGTQIVFRADVKCCTFTPQLANFLVGGILLDESAELRNGRDTLRLRMASRSHVSPLGVMVDPRFRTLYDLGSKEAFGRSEHLRCPHFSATDGGTCSIWPYRNGVCSTWFCKHERGVIGAQFWNCVSELLAAIEKNLSIWCARELHLSDRAIARSIARRSEPAASHIGKELVSNDVKSMELWDGWHGTTEEFFSACAVTVRGLEWEEVVRNSGPSALVLIGAAETALRALNAPPAIERPSVGQFQVSRHSKSSLSLGTYSPYNPLIISNDLFYLLHYFDGRPYEETVAEIRAEEGLDMDEQLIGRLLDFGVLKEASAGHVAGG